MCIGSSFSCLTNTEFNKILYVSKRQPNVVVFTFLTIRTTMVERGACQMTTTFKSLSASPEMKGSPNILTYSMEQTPS